MAKIKYIQPYGNQLMVKFDDATSVLALPTNNGIWIVSTTAAPPPPPPPPPVITPPTNGQYAVIFPCSVHSVSDSFQDHINRGSVNPGTDYTAPYGTEVIACAAGVVTDADSSYGGGGGRTIHIDHDDGTGADYLHLSRIDVSVGTHVAQGQHIALSGASGNGSEYGYGAHLHISYRRNHSHGYYNDGNIDFDALVRSEGLT